MTITINWIMWLVSKKIISFLCKKYGIYFIVYMGKCQEVGR
jgi:hypothetical protein